MESKLKSLSLQELASMEQIINAVCKKYENLAQMNKYSTSEADIKNYHKAANSLSYFNNKRDLVLDEMERRINDIVQ